MADIELVIKLDKEDFEIMKHNIAVNNPLCPLSQEKMVAIVAHGTPLPKGHGRLIDADKTISKICGSSCGCHLEECGHDKPCYSVTRISSAPTIIKADKEQ